MVSGFLVAIAAASLTAVTARSSSRIPAVFNETSITKVRSGSIPIISGFESILGIKSLLMGFGLAEDAIHSPNESYGLEQFDRGVETIPLFYRYFAAEK